MQRATLVLAALALLLAGSGQSRAGLIVTGTLSGSQEVPPNFITPASGSFSGVLNVSGPTATLAFTVSYTGLIGGDVVAASFNDAPAGSAGPDVKDYDPSHFSSPDGTFMGTWSSSDSIQPLTPALVSDLLKGDLYFEIDTQEFPGEPGELRGQLTVVPEPASLTLCGIAAASGLGYFGWRRRKRSVTT